ncbi:MAG: hypothetical protein ACKOFU_07415 [Actinomycetota bacterium]
MSLQSLYLHLSCLDLTSIGSGLQRCACEPRHQKRTEDCPNGFHLCFLCGISLAGGYSRWSWEVCANCLSSNEEFGRASGWKIPVGRHSVMNGIAIPINADAKALALASDALLGFMEHAQSLQEWGESEVRRLLEEQPKLKKLRFISIELWEKSHRPSQERSRDALQRFLESKRVTQ